MTEFGDYCRQVEAHLTRVNGGHLVRVAGAGFALVKQWADEGIPLSVVFRGIEQKAERHRAGASRRPLRIEFCEADVRDLYAAWRSAVGLTAFAGRQAGGTATTRRPATKTIDRAIERLGRLAGQLELSEAFRDAISRAIEDLAALRQSLSGVRGDARARLLERLPAIDRALMDAARLAISPDAIEDITRQAEEELAPYRARLSGEDWARAVSVTVDREVRERLALPALEA